MIQVFFGRLLIVAISAAACGLDKSDYRGNAKDDVSEASVQANSLTTEEQRILLLAPDFVPVPSNRFLAFPNLADSPDGGTAFNGVEGCRLIEGGRYCSILRDQNSPKGLASVTDSAQVIMRARFAQDVSGYPTSIAPNKPNSFGYLRLDGDKENGRISVWKYEAPMAHFTIPGRTEITGPGPTLADPRFADLYMEITPRTVIDGVQVTSLADAHRRLLGTFLGCRQVGKPLPECAPNGKRIAIKGTYNVRERRIYNVISIESLVGHAFDIGLALSSFPDGTTKHQQVTNNTFGGCATESEYTRSGKFGCEDTRDNVPVFRRRIYTAAAKAVIPPGMSSRGRIPTETRDTTPVGFLVTSPAGMNVLIDNRDALKATALTCSTYNGGGANWRLPKVDEVVGGFARNPVAALGVFGTNAVRFVAEDADQNNATFKVVSTEASGDVLNGLSGLADGRPIAQTVTTFPLGAGGYRARTCDFVQTLSFIGGPNGFGGTKRCSDGPFAQPESINNTFRNTMSPPREILLPEGQLCVADKKVPAFRRELSEVDADVKRVYKFYNVNTERHFFTTNGGERAVLAKIDPNALAEDTDHDFCVYKAQKTGTKQIFRLRHPTLNKHYYTLNPAERDIRVAEGYISEDQEVFGYAYPAGTRAPGLQPMFSLYRGKSSDHLYLPAVAFGGLRSADFAEYDNHGEWGVVPHCRQGDAKGRFKTLEQGELFLAAKPTETEQWYLKTRYGYCRLDGENEVADAASLFRYPLNKPARLYNRPDDSFEGSCNRKFMAGIVFRSQTRDLAITDGEGGYCLFPDPNKDIGLYSGVLESAQFGVRSQIFPSVSRLPARDRGLCLAGPSFDNEVFKKSGNNGYATCDAYCKGPQWGRVGSCLRTEFEGVTSREIKGNDFQPSCFEILPSYKLPLPGNSQLACYCTAKM